MVFYGIYSIWALFASAFTGESLLVTKGPEDSVYSDATCKKGEIEALGIATEVHTFFDKDAHLVKSTNQVGHFSICMIFSNVLFNSG